MYFCEIVNFSGEVGLTVSEDAEDQPTCKLCVWESQEPGPRTIPLDVVQATELAEALLEFVRLANGPLKAGPSSGIIAPTVRASPQTRGAIMDPIEFGSLKTSDGCLASVKEVKLVDGAGNPLPPHCQLTVKGLDGGDTINLDAAQAAELAGYLARFSAHARLNELMNAPKPLANAPELQAVIACAACHTPLVVRDGGAFCPQCGQGSISGATITRDGDNMAIKGDGVP